jgi:hypothetical protein
VGDLKFFVLMILIAVGGYLVFFADLSKINWGGPSKDRTPTITFVPKGTPGALTWEEYQEKRWGRLPKR